MTCKGSCPDTAGQGSSPILTSNLTVCVEDLLIHLPQDHSEGIPIETILSPKDRKKWERLLDSVETHVRGIPREKRSSPSIPFPLRVANEELPSSALRVPTHQLHKVRHREEQQFNLPSLTNVEEIISLRGPNSSVIRRTTLLLPAITTEENEKLLRD